MVEGKSESGGSKAVNIVLNWDRILSLGAKIIALLERKSKDRSSIEDVLNEYWAARYAIMFYELVLRHPVFDNETEIVTSLKDFLVKSVARAQS